MKIVILAALLAATPAAAATVHDLAWMAGDRAAGAAREAWLDGGDMLLGESVVVKDGKTVEYEHMRVGLTVDNHIAFFAAPSGAPFVAFTLKSLVNRRAVFENPAHDFPQRVIYWDAGNGAVGARIEGEIHGKAQSQEWLFKPRR